MALRPQFSMIPSEFNEFLFAAVGEETNGTLTVLSALTRLGIDPWVEAARLSELPPETAARALAAAITVLPVGHWKGTDLKAIAARLVTHLPRRSAPAAKPTQGERSGAKSRAVIGLVCLAFFAAVLFTLSHRQADRASEPPPIVLPSVQQ